MNFRDSGAQRNGRFEVEEIIRRIWKYCMEGLERMQRMECNGYWKKGKVASHARPSNRAADFVFVIQCVCLLSRMAPRLDPRVLDLTKILRNHPGEL